MRPSSEIDMLPPDNEYTKLRWFLTIASLFLYVVDIWTDIALALTYFEEGHFVWTGLTITFVLSGVVVTQIFSNAWYRDDMKDATNPEGETTISGMSGCELTVLHVFGLGIFTRYYHLLKQGVDVLWRTTFSNEEKKREAHHNLFCLATDLSFLKLFECFLESVPQLLLQLYIVLGRGECSVMQSLSMAFSFFNTAWALVDFRRCLRRSLPQVKEMPSGLPTTIYLLYKLCTITSHILSYAVLLMLSPYSAIGLIVLWVVWTIWTNVLQTSFCKTRILEHLYRAVIGVILTFTFFNVKGKDTKVAMTLYYLIYSVIHVAALLLLALLRPEFQMTTDLLVVSCLIFGLSLLGLVCLALYYLLLHPREKLCEADEVDGLQQEEAEVTRRRKNFIQL